MNCVPPLKILQNENYVMLLFRFIQHIREQQLFQRGDTLLLAVSGGVDSVVLCHLCAAAEFTFEIAHANFRLRGDESAEDESFVRSLAGHYHVPVTVKSFDTAEFAASSKISIQEAARELRYRWFGELIDDRVKYLVTAHHADDNMETVLMNFFRGTGISGLRGMLPVNGRIVRPLLPFTKKELIDYAQDHHLQWREDSSNASEKYSRNYFRNTIIPQIEKIYPGAARNVLANIERFRDVDTLYRQAVAVHKKRLLEFRENEVYIPILRLLKSEPLSTIVFELINAYGFTSGQVPEVIRLCHAAQGSHVESGRYRIFRNRAWLIISPVTSTESAYVLIEKDDKRITFSNGMLELKQIPAEKVNMEKSADLAFIDSRRLVFPLILRKWKAADYFYPLGLAKKKKVSRFLIDQKLSPTQKENVWVLETDKRICWVVGMRIDDRFKVTEATKEVLKIVKGSHKQVSGA